MTLMTTMTLEQAISLEPTFAKMQPDGTWKIPHWLEQFERHLALQELANTEFEKWGALYDRQQSLINAPSKEG